MFLRNIYVNMHSSTWNRDLRFMCCFRFNLWWMTQRIGSSGRDVPFETQFLLLEGQNGSKHSRTTNRESDGVNATIYILFLPLLDGSFRTCLQGNEDDELQLCMESGNLFHLLYGCPWFVLLCRNMEGLSFHSSYPGCPGVQMTGGEHSVFIYSGTDPFQVVADAVQ